MRKFNDILRSIRIILAAYCDDEILIRKWNAELAYLGNERRIVLHAPETHDEMKWTKLSNIINNCIMYPTPAHSWEQMIVDLFVGKLTSDEIITDIIYEGAQPQRTSSHPQRTSLQCTSSHPQRTSLQCTSSQPQSTGLQSASAQY